MPLCRVRAVIRASGRPPSMTGERYMWAVAASGERCIPSTNTTCGHIMIHNKSGATGFDEIAMLAPDTRFGGASPVLALVARMHMAQVHMARVHMARVHMARRPCLHSHEHGAQHDTILVPCATARSEMRQDGACKCWLYTQRCRAHHKGFLSAVPCARAAPPSSANARGRRWRRGRDEHTRCVD
jgi:ferredoxin-thioredoxin reductase catalytic subunit